VVRENIVAVDPISGLLADDIEMRVFAAFEGKCCIEVWENELVA